MRRRRTKLSHCQTIPPLKVSRSSIKALSDRISPALIKTLAQRRQKAVHLTKRAGRLLKASMKSVQQRWVAHVYEIRPRADKLRVDLISDALPFGRLWHGKPNGVSDADILRADATPASLNAAFTASTTANLSKD